MATETSPLSLAEWRLRSTMPAADVDALEVTDPGFLAATLADVTAEVYAVLAKRYVVPFASPVPRLVLRWITAIVTLEAYLKRGFNPESAQDALIDANAKIAREQIQAAANAETGLYELPLRSDLAASTGATKGGPFGYSEQSPYVWTTVQWNGARGEDESGRGT